LGNSDADLLASYVHFLKESLCVDANKIVIRVYCYLDSGLTEYEIEDYWLSKLNLPRENLRKSITNLQPKSSQQKGRKLKYGTCKISVYDTHLLQHVFGAIQEYAGIEKPEWLM